MAIPNIGHLFFREYYRGLTGDDWTELVTKKEPKLSDQATQYIGNKNKALLDAGLSHYSAATSLFLTDQNLQVFELKTTYPGLLIGSGWDHSAGKIDEEFKIGFSFDYTTGLPVVPGSSVKGAIRSAFRHKDYIQQLLDVTGQVDTGALEREIFEGVGRGSGNHIPLLKRDIFFDAYPVHTANKEDDRFLGDDYVTPHKDRYTNPIPIKFLKVLPGVIFRFQFRLRDGLINAGNKLRLFKNILLDIGVGAKTSVGYGQLEEVVDPHSPKAEIRQMQREKREKEAERQERLKKMLPVDRLFERHYGDINTIINAMRKNQAGLNDSEKIEAAERIKSVMVEKNIWKRPKKPKDKKRVKYIKEILGDSE